MTTTKLPRYRGIHYRGIHYLEPIKPVPPVTGCDDCDNGCHCDGAPGCQHWCCWGVGRGEEANTCPGAAAHREYMNACKTYREDMYAYQMTSHLR